MVRLPSALAVNLLIAVATTPSSGDAPEIEKRVIAGRLEAQPLTSFSAQSATPVDKPVPDYEWWYGCSPTAAGMLIGFYDTHGYAGKTYRELVPDAVAEASTFPSIEGVWDAEVQKVIASQRHVNDFYGGGHLSSGDDLPGAPTGPLDSLADFMGTSQDAYDNVNGGTAFWFRTDGGKLTIADLYGSGDVNAIESSGSYGIYQYFRHAGYGDSNPADVNWIYNQVADTWGLTLGFSLADYRAEIEAGRVVLLHLENHTVLAYGYDVTTGQLLIHDTATPGAHRIYWGGTYFGYPMFGVTVVDLTAVTGDPRDTFPALVPIIQMLLDD
jgi:hypothetical protein